MWFYSSPQIIFGEDALSYLEQVQGKRAFVVTDPTLVGLGLVKPVLDLLADAGISHQIFDQIEPEPSVATVRKALVQINDFQPDWFVAVGGGSVMDAAKAMWALYEWPHLSPQEISPVYPLQTSKAQMIAIPTTSGTGSEATWVIVLTDTEGDANAHRKLILGHRQLVPTLAIVDPVMTANLPPAITADTGMDVLTHAIEGFSANYHSVFSDPPCIQAAQMVLNYLPRAVAHGADDMTAREMMANAATLAALGFGNSQAGLAHALGHSAGSLFKISHGRVVGLFLPYIVQFTARAGVGRYDQLARQLGLIPHGTADGSALAITQGAEAIVAQIQQIMAQIAQPTRLADLGISPSQMEEQMETLCTYTMMDSAILAAPRPVEWDELAQLYLCAYEGKPVDF